MRTLCLPVAVGAAIVLASVPAVARDATPAPASAAADVGRCPVMVTMIIPDRGERGALIGMTTYGPSGLASGTIRLFSGDRAFDVPFTNVKVPQRYGERAAGTMPVAVKFAQGTHIDAAVVSSLTSGADAGPCELADPYIAPTRELVEDTAVAGERQPWRDAAKNAQVVEAPAPVTLPPAKCGNEVYTYPQLRSEIAPFDHGLNDRFRGHTAVVYLDVSPEGTAKSQMYLPTKDEAVDAGLMSRYDSSRWAPAHVRCKAVASAQAITFSGNGQVVNFIRPWTAWDSTFGGKKN